MLVVKQALTTTLVGIGAGTVLVLPGDAAAGAFRFEPSPHDATTVTLVAVLLCVMTLVASYVPARRTAVTDPLLGLRVGELPLNSPSD